MQSANWRSREARERGEAALGKRKPTEENYRSITQRTNEENRLKTERLRTLRLAKEASDREAEAAAGPASKKARRKSSPSRALTEVAADTE